MCETSKSPAAVRTARCSSTMPLYCTGISQPAKGTMRAAELLVLVVEGGALEGSVGGFAQTRLYTRAGRFGKGSLWRGGRACTGAARVYDLALGRYPGSPPALGVAEARLDRWRGGVGDDQDGLVGIADDVDSHLARVGLPLDVRVLEHRAGGADFHAGPLHPPATYSVMASARPSRGASISSLKRRSTCSSRGRRSRRRVRPFAELAGKRRSAPRADGAGGRRRGGGGRSPSACGRRKAKNRRERESFEGRACGRAYSITPAHESMRAVFMGRSSLTVFTLVRAAVHRLAPAPGLHDEIELAGGHVAEDVVRPGPD